MAASAEVTTTFGPARVQLRPVDAPRAALVLGHGAAGGVNAPDLVAAAEAANAERVSVALVEHPYRVAGRRTPAPAPQADAAWVQIVEQLRTAELKHLRVLSGGRSWGARVACRTATELGVAGVLCLAFPLQPRRRPPNDPPPSRLHELDAVTVPTLVVQGERDAFGIPPPSATRTVARIRGDHSLRSDTPALAAAVRAWLPMVLDS